MAKARQRQTEEELAILFPFKDVKLRTGETLTVREWNIEKGARATPIAATLLQRLAKAGAGGNVELPKLMEVALPEVRQLVCITLDMTEAELDRKLTWDDFISVVQAIIDTCLVTDDGRGLIPKIVELVQIGRGLARAQSPSSSPSMPSSEPATASPNSGA